MMRYIANRYIEQSEREATPFPGIQQIKQVLISKRSLLLSGVVSTVLYSLLYLFSKDLISIAQSAHQGDKAMFFVPIVIALLFSLVHGIFTSHFWDSLGVKAKTK